jgi:hypothetical protein
VLVFRGAGKEFGGVISKEEMYKFEQSLPLCTGPKDLRQINRLFKK